MASAVALITGFLLDALIGDPHRLSHPVRFFGFLISSGEKTMRRYAKTPWAQRIAGIVLSIYVIAVATAIPALILFFAWHFFWLWFALETWMCFRIRRQNPSGARE